MNQILLLNGFIESIAIIFFSIPGHTTTYCPLYAVPAEYNPRFNPGSTSTPHPMHRPRSESLTLRVPPISTVLFPDVGSCQMPTPSKCPPAMPPSDERSQAMKKWAEGRAHIQQLVDCDKTPPKEDCLLVFQCLMMVLHQKLPLAPFEAFHCVRFCEFQRKWQWQLRMCR